MRVEAVDQKINGGILTRNLELLAAEETRLNVETAVNLFGKIGEFGQPMSKKKADQMMTEFADNVAGMVGTAPVQDQPQTGSILSLLS